MPPLPLDHLDFGFEFATTQYEGVISLQGHLEAQTMAVSLFVAFLC